MSFTVTPHANPGLGAGFRYSTYGPAYNPGVEYWANVCQEMASRFPGSTPEIIWVVSVLEGEGTRLTFPGNQTDSYISFSTQDENETALTHFDQLGFRVWLQVEPGEAKVETLFDLILSRYGSHPCVVGVGVDVEWHHSSGEPEGEPVSDDEATRWLAAARVHGEQYQLFLKHWETSKLPPGLREGLLFVDDSQMFTSLDQMVAEFAEWGRYFAPAPVAFQIGYPQIKSGGMVMMIQPRSSEMPYSKPFRIHKLFFGWTSPSWKCSRLKSNLNYGMMNIPRLVGWPRWRNAIEESPHSTEQGAG